MIENLPNWVNVLFVATSLLAIGIFYFANGKPKRVTLLIVGWTIVQAIFGYTSFYHNTQTTVPRFGLVLLPPLLLVLYSFLPKQRAWVLKNRNTKISTFLHLIRLPIEIALFQLFLYQMIPELMTFEGRNFDIIIGLTAPIVGLLYWKDKIGKKSLLAWNIVGLCFVTFILVNGVLSAELPFQQFGFEQPNRAVIYFPFVLLPAIIVPIVIWTHLTDIMKLRMKNEE